MGELRIHTKFLLENVKRGDVLGDVDIDFVDENELTIQKCFVMV
jgi:phosphotransferase system IIA component